MATLTVCNYVITPVDACASGRPSPRRLFPTIPHVCSAAAHLGEFRRRTAGRGSGSVTESLMRRIVPARPVRDAALVVDASDALKRVMSEADSSLDARGQACGFA